MEEYYSLGELKTRVIIKLYKSSLVNENEFKKLKDDLKYFLSPMSLVNERLSFAIKESDKFLMNKTSINALYVEIEKKFGLDVKGIEEGMFSYHFTNATPIKFDSFDDFKIFTKKGKMNSEEKNDVLLFLDGKFKTKKQIRKDKSRELKEKSSASFNKKMLESFNEDTAFLSIDFECLYLDNNVPVEVGISLFKVNESFERSHYIFEENLTNGRKQPKKFRQTGSFSYGESVSLKEESIRDNLSKAISKVDYVICHASQLERRMLKRLGVEFESKKIIDSQLWYKSKKGEKQVKSLERIAEDYNMNDVKFHNAGNDAVITGFYFCELLKEDRPELFIKKEKSRVSTLKRRSF
jgi:hypothetical protein